MPGDGGSKKPNISKRTDTRFHDFHDDISQIRAFEVKLGSLLLTQADSEMAKSAPRSCSKDHRPKVF